MNLNSITCKVFGLELTHMEETQLMLIEIEIFFLNE